MPTTEIVHFGDQAVEIVPQPDGEFLTANAEVAALYDVPVKNLDRARQRNPEKLREGRHFVWAEGDNMSPSGNLLPGGGRVLLWTKRGAIRVSECIRSPRGIAVQDWLEDLAIEKLARGPEIDHSPLTVALADLTNKISEAVATGTKAVNVATEALGMAASAHDRLVDTDNRLGHTEYRVGKAAGYVKTSIDPAIVSLDVRVAALEAQEQPAVEEPRRVTAYLFTRLRNRHEVDRGPLGLYAEEEARKLALAHEMREVTNYQGEVVQVHAWPESVWVAALEEYDRRLGRPPYAG